MRPESAELHGLEGDFKGGVADPEPALVLEKGRHVLLVVTFALE